MKFMDYLTSAFKRKKVYLERFNSLYERRDLKGAVNVLRENKYLIRLGMISQDKMDTLGSYLEKINSQQEHLDAGSDYHLIHTADIKTETPVHKNDLEGCVK